MKFIFVTAAVACAALSNAAPIFFDNYESGVLSQYQANGSGAITADPVNGSNKVLHFLATTGGGDIFSNNFFLTPGTTYIYSLDYLGVTSGGINPDGFAGTDGAGGEQWKFGVSAFPSPVVMVNDNTWHHYSIAITGAGSTLVKLEDFVGGGSAPGQAYFDNVTVAAVPEPTSMAALALGGLGLIRRRRSARS